VAGDDWWQNTGKLQIQVDFLENNPDYGLVFSNTYVYSQAKAKHLKFRPIRVGYTFDQLIIQNCIPALTTCYSKKLFDEYIIDVNPVKENFPGEDYPMWLWFAYKSSVFHINEPLTTYRLHTEALSHSNSKQRRLQFEVDRINIKLFFYNHFKVDNEDILHDIYLQFYFLTLNSASQADNQEIENERDLFFKNNEYNSLLILSKLNRKFSKSELLSHIMKYVGLAYSKFGIMKRYYKIYSK
jgi:hypothetical protein